MATEKNQSNFCCNIVSAAFKTMLEYTKDMIFMKDANGVYVAASMPFVRMVGKQKVEEILGRTDLEIFEDENLAKRYIADDHKLLEGGRDLIDYTEPLADDNGQPRYGSTSKHILHDPNGTYIGILGITKDITRDFFARQHYQQELQYLFELPEDTYAVCYIDVDDWRIISQRRQLIKGSTLEACNTVEELCEVALEDICDDNSKAAKFYRNFNLDSLKEIYSSGRIELSFTYQRMMPDGSRRWVRNGVRFLTDVDTGHMCVMLSAKDIDRKKKKEQELVRAAQVDRMTMLLNRETTMENIQKILKNEADRRHVLFMIDVDNFKDLNDTLGHQAGDEFLVALTAQISSCFRGTDIVGRIGGDEFFVLMRNVQGTSAVTGKTQELFGAIQKVCEPYSDVAISGSIGISCYPEDGKTLEELYAAADRALYQAKRKGKNQFVFASAD